MKLIANSIVSVPGIEIPNSVALKLIQTYRLEDGWATYKTRAAWFSLEDLYKIIDQINAKKGDGVRIYLGKYPCNINIPDTPNILYKIQSRTTLVFVPTTKDSDGTHKNIFDITGLTAPGQSIDIETDDPKDSFDHGELEP